MRKLVIVAVLGVVGALACKKERADNPSVSDPASQDSVMADSLELVMLLDPTVMDPRDSPSLGAIDTAIGAWIRHLPSGACLRVFRVGSGNISDAPEFRSCLMDMRSRQDRAALSRQRDHLADSVSGLYRGWWTRVHRPETADSALSCIRSGVYRIERATRATRVRVARYLLVISDLVESCNEKGLEMHMEHSIPGTLSSELLANGGLHSFRAVSVVQVRSRHVMDIRTDQELANVWTALFKWLGVPDDRFRLAPTIGDVPWSE